MMRLVYCLLFLVAATAHAQVELPAVLDPAAADEYEYGYEQLTEDVMRWAQHPRVRAGNIGTSVHGRTLYELRITAPTNYVEPRDVVTIHARTHPNEPQSSHVVNAIIEHLLSDDPAMVRLLERTVFHIVPMLNPDGVELRNFRYNANGRDLEREWDKDPAEKEAVQLKNYYRMLMESPTPIRVALNLHSHSLCRRFFVYHVPEGTSERFGEQQRRFIDAVRAYFREGIEPWSYNQSWGPPAQVPTHFPESWFWFNFREDVLALTYEDMHCPQAGAYDTTAYAILRGVADYLQLDVSSVEEEHERLAVRGILRSVAPNPFAGETTIRYALPRSSHVSLRVFDAVGAEVATLLDGAQEAGWHELRWTAADVAPGVYYVVLQAGTVTNTLPVVRIR